MKVDAIALFLCVLSINSHAATKHLECNMIMAEGVKRVLLVTLDDNSDKAEVLNIKGKKSVYCKSNSCVTKVYQAEALPSVIRLSKSKTSGLRRQEVIDIHRKNLSVSYSNKIQIDSHVMESKFSAKCSIAKVDENENLI